MVVSLCNRSSRLCVLGKVNVQPCLYNLKLIVFPFCRPLTISDADCDVDYPNPHDTEFSQFTHLVKLSCILGDILRALCSPRARMMSGKGHGLENISRSLEKMLLDWKASLPEHLTLSDIELARIARKEINPALQTKLNNGAGKLRFVYCAVYLLSKRPFISLGTGYASNVNMPIECQETMRIAVDLFENIEVTSLLCCWSLSSKKRDPRKKNMS